MQEKFMHACTIAVHVWQMDPQIFPPKYLARTELCTKVYKAPQNLALFTVLYIFFSATLIG